ncbi:LamG-like jellyroll fold domain-containing protein [Catellatospora coxensis]
MATRRGRRRARPGHRAGHADLHRDRRGGHALRRRLRGRQLVRLDLLRRELVGHHRRQPGAAAGGTSADARARTGSSSWRDYTVTARIKPTAFNGSNRFTAVIARAQSNTSYYYLALRSNHTVELKKLVGGSSTTLATGSVTVTTGAWYTLSLSVSGTALRGTVNGATALTAVDGQFATGGIGVATFYAAASFDDVTVSDSVAPSPSASPRRRPRRRAARRPARRRPGRSWWPRTAAATTPRCRPPSTPCR